MESVNVAVGVLVWGEQVLIALRPKHKHQGGLWEFPGGKVETSESVIRALLREFMEEVGLDLTQVMVQPFLNIPFTYPDKNVLLEVFWLEVNDALAMQAKGLEGQEIRWVKHSELDHYHFPEANRVIVEAIRQRFSEEQKTAK
ncbi:MAG: NUDIX domain-containing protein [Venatoribacter sp.]